MDALDLDPDGYSGSYKLIGGSVALDFINTVSWWGTAAEHDWLSSPENVSDWGRAVDIKLGPVTAAELYDIRGVREVLAAVISPLAHNEHPPARVVAAFNVLLDSTMHRRMIDPASLDWNWLSAASAVDRLAPVVLDAAEIVTTRRGARLKFCPSCDWLFEDRTRNGRRRWCDMADCGSRAKSRDYYYRRKAERS